MGATWKVLDPVDAGRLRNEQQEFAFDVLEGLSERPKRLSARWFYDKRGSELFAKIMDVPQYYLTDCEREILEARSLEMAAAFAGKPFDVVDLGAGDGRKTQLVLERLSGAGHDIRYVPIDISEKAIELLVSRLEGEMPKLEIKGLVSEYTDGLHWLRTISDRPKLVLFLGSNIGNFNKSQARGFLRRLWTVLCDGDMVLIGFDLKKDIDLLLSAYNDPMGVTSEFNLNLLRRINRELDADFDVEKFRHFGTYNVFSGAMESYLVSLIDQEVRIGAIGQSFTFDSWEPIHTEYSYKYLPSDIEQLAEATGYAIEARYLDRRSWFVDALFRVQKS